MPSNIPNTNTLQLGMWDESILVDLDKLNTFNRDQIDITKDQLRHLYVLLYPFIASEFVHRSDMHKYIATITKEFQDKVDILNEQHRALKKEMDLHTHIGNLGGPTSPVTIAPAQPVQGFTQLELELWKSQPEDDIFKLGEELIVSENDMIPSLQQRDPDKAAINVENTSEDIKTDNQISGGDILPPFDVDEGNLVEPNTFST